MLTDRTAISRSFFLAPFLFYICLVLLAYLSSQRKLYSIKSAKRRVFSLSLSSYIHNNDDHNHYDVDE
jgi:hypothetical protein